MTTLVICDLFVLYKCVKSKVNSIAILVSMLLVSNFLQCFGSGLNRSYYWHEGNQKLVWASIFIGVGYAFITLPLWIFAMRYWKLSLRMEKISYPNTEKLKIDLGLKYGQYFSFGLVSVIILNAISLGILNYGQFKQTKYINGVTWNMLIFSVIWNTTTGFLIDALIRIRKYISTDK